MVLNSYTAPAIVKLGTFADLPAGWCYGSGGPISPYVLARGRDILREYLANGFTKLDAIPVETGEVQLLAYKDRHRVSLIVSDVSAEFSHESGDDVVSEADDLNTVAIRHHIRKAAEDIWGMCDSSTQKITKSIVAASATSAFVSLSPVGSRYSIPTALQPLAA